MTIQELPPAPPMPPRPNRPGSRARVTLIVILSLLLVLVLGGIWWVVSTNNSIDRLPDEETSGLTAPVTDATTILIVGSDSREDLGGLEGPFGNFGGARTDVIMLARIDPEWIEYVELDGVGHAEVLDVARERVLRLLLDD